MLWFFIQVLWFMVWISGPYGYVSMVLIVMHSGIYPDTHMDDCIKKKKKKIYLYTYAAN